MTPPPLAGVLETVLYYDADQHDAVERFYEDVLGFRSIGKARGRFMFFRAGADVYLLFNRRASTTQDRPLPHGPGDAVHTCFVVPEDAYEAWKAYLPSRGVDVADELTWSRGGVSFYFHDPAGNLLEIANRDFWPE